MIKIKTLAIAGLLSALLTACGFQLRGQLNLPDNIEPIFISAANSQLGIEIRNLFSSNNIALTDQAGDANYKLVLLQQERDRRTLSVGADANAVEYQLIETAVFAIEDGSGKVVLAPKTLTERRVMRNDPDQVVSKGEEEALIRNEMLRSLAAKIVRQFSTLGRSGNDETAP
jgi:LPS-assembly lipoprotein